MHSALQLLLLMYQSSCDQQSRASKKEINAESRINRHNSLGTSTTLNSLHFVYHSYTSGWLIVVRLIKNWFAFFLYVRLMSSARPSQDAPAMAISRKQMHLQVQQPASAAADTSHTQRFRQFRGCSSSAFDRLFLVRQDHASPSWQSVCVCVCVVSRLTDNFMRRLLIAPTRALWGPGKAL